MNYSQLQAWLKLPPGPWPPSDRALLGLPESGAVDATTVELKALERMDMLRPHQLRHALLVTEGMNRLAQAMIALTAGEPPPAPVAPKKPRKEHREHTPLEIRKADGDVKLDLGFDAGASPASATISLPASAPILEAEVIGVAPAAAAIIPESIAVQSDESADLLLDEPIVIPEPPPGAVIAPSKRRQGYKEKVRIRQLRQAWSRFRSLLGDPREKLTTPAKIASYLDAIAELRNVLEKNRDGLVVFPDLAGGVVLSVVCHPVPLSLLRDLILSQRRALARDWAIADADLEAKAKRLSRAMKRTSSAKPVKQLLRQVMNIFRMNPEWIILLLIMIAIVIGFWRT
ncbi:MAG: hypothetical protein U0798_12290 [Gemmataceae bacterium]